MKKVTLRAYSTVLLALLVIVGLIVYVIRYIDDGASWALYFDETTTKCTYTLTDASCWRRWAAVKSRMRRMLPSA